MQLATSSCFGFADPIKGFRDRLLPITALRYAAFPVAVRKSSQLKRRHSRKSKAFFGGTNVKRSLWGWMLFCILSTSLSLFSQTATTSLRGTIKDPTGALVPGAKITLSDNANGQTFSALANSSGQYVFAQIPPAKYTITATSQGFGTQSKVAELLVNQPATIDFALTVHTETVTVDVSATAQTLNRSEEHT